jgi:hypothetical protein
MNLQITAILFASALAAAGAWGWWQYHAGWAEGRAALEQEQANAAQIELASKLTRQQATDTAAAEAQAKGSQTHAVITRDVIKYVKIPDRTSCVFDSERLRIKTAAVRNANTLAGFDAATVPAQ